MSNEEYKLSSVLYGHSLDVRALDVNKEDCILSGSRDKTSKFWKPNGFNSGFTDALTFKGHKNYVSAVCFLDPSPNCPNGLIVTGGNDSLICVYNTNEPEPFISVKGHSNTVCSLRTAKETSTFLSSSWDCSAKLWVINNNTLKEKATFTGHQAAVWSAIQLPNGHVATGSADKDIIIWSEEGRKIKTLTGHTDCVRSLAVLGDSIFLSVANDASIKQWTFEGDCIETLYGHSNYIYSVAVNPCKGDNCFVTSSEDRTVKYWKNGQNTQTITLPAQSIWAVACLPNGDIVTGSSDGLVRVFTQDPLRIADEATLKTFEEEVASLNVAQSQEIGGVKISDLPGREVLYEPGKSDGQTKLVREGTQVICYSWSVAEGTWNKVGDVMGAAGGTQATSGKTLHEGKEYDFVFSVDIEDGAPPIKLPYNSSQDPWFAAQEFIHKHSLPQAYLDQVANFIVQNSGGKQQVSQTQTTDFVDPFTGGNRYVPGSTGNMPGSNSGMNLDPFTGTSSYSTNQSQPRPNVPIPQTGAADPFTGSSAYTTSTQSQQVQMVQTTTYFPQLQFLKFTQGNTSVIFDKLRELNSSLGADGMDISLLEGVIKLADGDCGEGLYLDILMQLLNWPQDLVFPVLDIVRLAVRHPENNLMLCSHSNGEFLINLLRKFISQDSVANKMLSLRIFCNMFSHSPGEAFIVTYKTALLEDIGKIDMSNANKNIQIAVATFLLNLGVALARVKDNVGIMLLCTIVLKIIPKLSDQEAEFRSFVALGTVLSQVDETVRRSIIKSIETFNKLREKIAKYDTDNFNDDNPNYRRNLNCAKQLQNLIYC